LIQPENFQTSLDRINTCRTGSGQIGLPESFICSSEEETFALGKRLASMLGKGDVVALNGPLGAGKTCFTKGIAVGLCIGEEITSPSYAIICEYECLAGGEEIPFYHIDAYRLEGDGDFSAIGGEDIVYGNGISVIEWGDRIPAFIPSGAYRLDFEIIEDDKRSVKIVRQGG
jgi:tRNA threonylcarbamoyladenosine biosynthesis protein TsaE